MKYITLFLLAWVSVIFGSINLSVGNYGSASFLFGTAILNLPALFHLYRDK